MAFKFITGKVWLWMSCGDKKQGIYTCDTVINELWWSAECSQNNKVNPYRLAAILNQYQHDKS